MIEEPDFPVAKIINAVAQAYGLRVSSLQFIPHGWDTGAWSYKVTAEGAAYFLKLRKEMPNPAGVLLPRFLREQGIEQVIVPLRTRSGQAWMALEGYVCILYPFVKAEQVKEIGMSDEHWVEFGIFLKRLHSIRPSGELLQQLRREDYMPRRIRWVKEVHAVLKTTEYTDPFERGLAAFWRERYATISILIERTERLAQRLQRTELEYVLCHADIHTANVLRSNDDRIFIVDWDECLLAPKERDLLFVLGESAARETELFFTGYGRQGIDSLALAYYRYDWCIEDIGGFADRIFTSEKIGDKTKKVRCGGSSTCSPPETALRLLSIQRSMSDDDPRGHGCPGLFSPGVLLKQDLLVTSQGDL